MKNLIILTLAIVALNVSAQVMPSPDASKLIKDINIPVNNYTGVASVSVPLYQASSNNGFSVPVSLQYNTGGIKVREISGVAGLGWNLIAGGQITRIVRDKPDELYELTTSVTGQNMRNHFKDNDLDFESDLFYFSMPGGQGRFIFEGDIYDQANDIRRCNQAQFDDCVTACGSSLNCIAGCDSVNPLVQSRTCSNWYFDDIVTLTRSDVDIKFYYTSETNSYWVITDPSGNKYYFGQNSTAREVTVSNGRDHTTGALPDYDPANEEEFVSTWHLTTVVPYSQSANNSISFTYGSEITIDEEFKTRRTNFNTDYFNCINSCVGDTNCNACQYDDGTYTAYLKTSIGVNYLTKISFPKGSVEFSYADRSDHSTAQRLSSIQLKDHNGNLVSNTVLNQDYFDAADAYLKGGKYGYSSDEKWKRLKLNSLTKDGLIIRSFDYANDKEFHTGGIDKYELPPRDSYYTDHWGYYNGGPHHGQLYLWNPFYQYITSSNTLTGMDKTKNGYAKANILTKVTLPTGGYTRLSYDVHGNHGGVRIDTIQTFDENGVRVSGQDFQYDNLDENSTFIPTYRGNYVDHQTSDGDPIGYSRVSIIENAANLIFKLNGEESGYKKMIVKDLMTGSWVKYNYIDVDDPGKELVPPTQTLEKTDVFNGNVSGFTTVNTYTNGILGYPFVTNSLEFYDLGQPDTVEYYDESNTKVMEEVFVYEHVNNSVKVENNNIVLYNYDCSDGSCNYGYYQHLVSNYYIRLANFRLKQRITRTFEDGLTMENTAITDYHSTYRTLPRKVTSLRTDVPGGESVKSQSYTFYPSDYNSISSYYTGSQTILNNMVSEHMIGIPISSQTQVDVPNDNYSGYWTSSVSFVTFQETGFPTKIYPFETYSYDIGHAASNWDAIFDVRKLSTSSYNSSGLLGSQTGTDGIETTYLYNSQGYLTSETIHPDPNDNSLNQTTTYTHKSLVGLESVTSPTGETLSYEYNHRNELHLIRDTDNDIIKRYRYNYANEAISASIEVTGSRKIGETITFKATDVLMYGPGEYQWFIDGTNKTGETVTHTFSSSGSKPIKLTIVNSEYDAPKEITADVMIYAGDWSLTSISGETNPCIGDSENYSVSVAQGAHGCENGGSYTYSWEYRTLPSGSYQSLSSNTSYVTWNVNTGIGDVEIKVTVTDACGRTVTQTKTIDVKFCGFGG